MTPSILRAASKSAGVSIPIERVGRTKTRILTPRGERLRQERVRTLAREPGMTLVCGRYEGMDERVRRYVDLEISVGDFVLSAGDPAAWCLV